ncbi:MAG: ATP-dependent DNA helicase RecG [Alphaproteobacteria bacterium]|nr:MAG: ATP-dependent DNA helicase RecG [Alphaproteobacteria bacterium]
MPSLSLDQLLSPLVAWQGLRGRWGKLFEKLVGPRVADALWLLPQGLVDRRASPPLDQAQAGQIVTIFATVHEHRPPSRWGQPWKVRLSDGHGMVELVFFNPRAPYLNKILPPGGQVTVSGHLESFDGHLTMPHPDIIESGDARAEVAILEPVRPLTAGLTGRFVRQMVERFVAQLPEWDEWIDPALLRRQGWPSWRGALMQAHAPQDEAGLQPDHPARQRLAYDELLAQQLALALIRRHARRQPGRVMTVDGKLRLAVLQALPFRLTAAQDEVLAQIDADMASTWRMRRLLQGDVGSGKTVVAALACLNAISGGAQAALMVPTELLARQHAQTLTRILAPAGIDVLLLTGALKGAARQQALERLAQGDPVLAVGTHALFQKGVAFARLGLAVVDEQHRFGVHQRVHLADKGQDDDGKGADLLVMTATPIPRSLALTFFGDLDVSRLEGKPPGRSPVATRVLNRDRIEEVTAALQRAIARGEQAYWVCPLIGEDTPIEEQDKPPSEGALAAAVERHRALRRLWGDQVGLVHGRLKSEEKAQVMEAFVAGRIRVLVATTVIEVGVDVPSATVMVIEQAERFGMAQLHQLRGRVGRGTAASHCLLLYQGPLGQVARQRLQAMRQCDDGFVIAEEDLRLRGPGEILGARQSGLAAWRLADPVRHGDLLLTARDDVKLILERDPKLTSKRGQALRTLLALFQAREAVKTLESG